MNVLIVTVLAAHSPSGVVSYYNRLADDLRAQGMTVSLLDSSDTPYLWRKVLGVLKRLMWPLGQTSRAVYEEFAQFTGMYFAVRSKKLAQPDLIHAQDAKSGAAAFLAFGKVPPVVMTCHFNDSPVSELAERFSLSASVQRRLVRWYTYLFSHVRNYVFVSNYAYDRSKHLLPADIRRITIHNTVNIETTDKPADKATTQSLIISNVGYVDERKNQQLLLRIGYELNQLGLSNFQLWFIGEGPKLAEYRQLAEQLGLTSQVQFYGRQTAPWRLVEQSDLYVHTALNDNCPYSIIEAFAVETPVLALPVGGIPEMLPQGAGLLRGSTPAEMAAEVARYFDPAQRTALALAQQSYADQHFNHRKSLTDLLSFYQQTELAA